MRGVRLLPYSRNGPLLWLGEKYVTGRSSGKWHRWWSEPGFRRELHPLKSSAFSRRTVSPTDSPETIWHRYREPFVGESVSLFREPDAGNLAVGFDEREQETGSSQTGLRGRGESLVTHPPGG